jgi:hypothetical protein
MIVNFKAAREISRGVRKLTRTPTLIKKNIQNIQSKNLKLNFIPNTYKIYLKHIFNKVVTS